MRTGFPRLAVVSHTLPPARNGQAIMMERILSGLDPADYFFISARDLPELAGRMPVKHVQVPPQAKRLIPYRLGLRPLIEPINFQLCAAHRAECIARAVREERAGAIVACSGDLIDLPAAYLAARKLGLPLIVYFFDWYAHQFDAALRDDPSGPRIVAYARRMEPIVLGAAHRILVPNEYLRSELRKSYGLQATIVRNPTEFTAPTSGPGSWPRSTDGRRIVYTGSIYEAHFDAFHNLLASLKLLGRPWRLAIYSGQSLDYLRANGISGPIDVYPAVAPSEVQALQRAADVLFLPLAFQSPYPEIVRTSAPGKIGDYLASGAPILVHAPEESFLAWYFRQHECGVVVDRLNPDSLAASLESLTRDEALRDRCRRNAAARAADFSVAEARRAFATAMVPPASPGTRQVVTPQSTPSVSVVIPTYNRATLVCEAIDSILSQDYPQVEIIVVDDGSTDDTAAILAAYGDRIRHVVQPNAGPAVARNHGVRLATGDYVTFLDSDDLYLPGKIRKQVEHLQAHPETVLVYCRHEILTKYRTYYSDPGRAYEGEVHRALLGDSSSGPLATPTIMVRRDVLAQCGGFDETMGLAEDTDLWCRIAARGSFGLVPDYLVRVRLIDRGISTAPRPQAVMTVWQRILDKAASSYPSPGRLFLRKAQARLLLNAWKISRSDAQGTQWGLLVRALLCWPLVWIGAGLGEYALGLPRVVLLAVVRRLVPARTYIRTRNRWRVLKHQGVRILRATLRWISGKAEKQF